MREPSLRDRNERGVEGGVEEKGPWAAAAQNPWLGVVLHSLHASGELVMLQDMAGSW